ncbi:MAG: phosphatidylserine decarboxylase family protein [Bacteroidia bacterium]|nr:phosphatidylserine decarboxylase family protein [Bacteroidia bacterium]NNJ55571.1 phosphatidylserine decarboxylase family protein [Bacteroidia bacterium]
MKIHREGYKIILIATLILVAVLYALTEFNAPVWLTALIGIPLLVLYILVIRFFRNPERYSDKTENGVVCPCDGKVVVIEEVEETEYFKDKRIQISIFMSPLNVHVNRNPISGIVQYFKYHPGKYLVAWHPKSSTENERTTTVIKQENGTEILFRQIAGAVARRIRWYVKPEMKVTQGNEMGFIKFGSRVDVYLPIGSDVRVSLEQKVSAAETLLAICN